MEKEQKAMGFDCEQLAVLLSYPRPEQPWGDFGAEHGLSLEQLQELYVQTFDWNPATCLEIGWHLYGEQYDRGEFLVKMRQELRRHGLEESAELPDHLSHALRLAARMEPGEAEEFREKFVRPAVEKILPALNGNPYQRLLREAIQ